MDYKEKTYFIGSSDIASLTVRFPTKAETLDFGMDGEYAAHFVANDEDVPPHYHKVMSGERWCKVYDDYGLTTDIEADEIDIYQAGEMGALIVAKSEHPAIHLFGCSVSTIDL